VDAHGFEAAAGAPPSLSQPQTLTQPKTPPAGQHSQRHKRAKVEVKERLHKLTEMGDVVGVNLDVVIVTAEIPVVLDELCLLR
jgi:hypothetical protein